MKTLIRILILFFGLIATTKVHAQGTFVDFDTMPKWTDTLFHGYDPIYTNPLGGIGGGRNKCLQVNAYSYACTSIKTLTMRIPLLTLLEVSGYMKVPSQTFNYNIHFAFKTGRYPASDFDANPSTWTEIVSFTNTGANGNGNSWVGYFNRLNSIVDTNITVVLATSSDSPMIYHFDDLLVNKVALLPVELVSFNAEKSGNGTLLNWETATEINNSRFDILRSTDGKGFENIGTIPGAGNSNSILKYSYMDNTIISSSPVIYYRLKQTDFNGKFSYSEIIRVTNGEETASTFKVYPNPFTNNINWEFATVQGKKYTIKMYDIYGQVVYSTYIENATMGTIIPNTNLPHGIYILSLDDETSSIQRIKIQH